MGYIFVACVFWPLAWLGMRHYFGDLHWVERGLIVTVMAVMWPLGIVMMACIDHADRHP